MHTESDLRAYLAWCAERDVDPLAAERAYLELYVRWIQEVRRFKPSTVSRWGCRWWPASAAPASSTECWLTRRPNTCATAGPDRVTDPGVSAARECVEVRWV